jgi:hypothetical protein
VFLMLTATAQVAQIASPSALPAVQNNATASADVSSYNSAFFAGFRPSTAYDMIGRLPGFVFNAGQTARGYEDTAGNVLINGQRPPTKSDNLQDILIRIPASAVVRLDLIKGGSTNVNTYGYSVIANVILKPQQNSNIGSIYTNFYSDGRVGYGGRLELNRSIGPHNFSNSVLIFDEEGVDAGSGSYKGAIAGFGLADQKTIKETNPEVGATIQSEDLIHAELGDVDLKSTLSYIDFQERQYGDPNSTGIVASDGLSVKDITSRAEFSGELRHIFNDSWSSTTLLLQNLGRERTNSNSVILDTDTYYNRSAFSGETIIRNTDTYQHSENLSFQFGAEGAYNFLNSRALVTVAADPIALPGGTAHVQEVREEAFGTANWSLLKNWHLELGFRVENSNISTASQGAQTNESFTFPKPRALLSWDVTKADQLRVRAEREVGQLDFSDFAASADLARGTVSAGNAHLQPQRDWIYEAAWQHAITSRGSLVVTVNHADLEQVIDQVLLDGSSAPGNIPHGTRDTASVTLTLPLDNLGLKRALVTTNETWRSSSVIDPLTGEVRRISGEVPHQGSISITQDVPALQSTWRITMNEDTKSITYYANQIENVGAGRTVDASWEVKPRSGMALLIQVKNAFGRRRYQDEMFFSPDRGDPAITETTAQRVKQGPYLYLRLRSNF